MTLRPPGAGVDRRAKASRKRFISSPSVFGILNHPLSFEYLYLGCWEGLCSSKINALPKAFRISSSDKLSMQG